MGVPRPPPRPPRCAASGMHMSESREATTRVLRMKAPDGVRENVQIIDPDSELPLRKLRPLRLRNREPRERRQQIRRPCDRERETEPTRRRQLAERERRRRARDASEVVREP